MKCLFFNTYYPEFLGTIYSNNLRLSSQTYSEQLEFLYGSFFGDSNFYSKGLSKGNWEAVDIVVNNEVMQKQWALENSFSYSHPLQIAIAQIAKYKPDVVYIQDLNYAVPEIIDAIRPYTSLIVGQIAYPLNEGMYIKGLDIIFSSFPHYVKNFRNLGITSYYLPLAFEPKILQHIDTSKKIYPASFVGSLSVAHSERLNFFDSLTKEINVDFWGPSYKKLEKYPNIVNNYKGEAWGIGMFQQLAYSLITFNKHIDVAENYANNMRLFEATGSGSLLITDYKDNLSDLFEIGKEVVAYRNTDEAISLAKYYLNNPTEALEIALAGQKRTLKDHTYNQRMYDLSEILTRHLKYKSIGRPIVDFNKISYGYSELGSIEQDLVDGWKNESIPLKQRELVQNELLDMYNGKVNKNYSTLADLTTPLIDKDCKVLEIGCSSGYYSEVLDYLLNKKIRYTGVDYSEAMINMASQFYPLKEFYVRDGKNLGFDDHSFDIVISGGVLLHCPNYEEHIKESVRVAKKYIILHRTPLVKVRNTLIVKKMAYGVETVELRFNEKEILTLMNKFGCELIQEISLQNDEVNDLYEKSFLFEIVN